MTTQDASHILHQAFNHLRGVSFRARLWDGSSVEIGPSPTFTLVFRDEETFSHLFRSQDVYAFAVAFVQNRFDIEGDYFAALRLKDTLRAHPPAFLTKLYILRALGLRGRHNRRGDIQNVQAHYEHLE